MTETIDTANLRALAENIIAADGPIWWIEQDFRAVKEVLDATIDDARFVAAANPTTIIALLDRLAAAAARNATLTDDAARYRWLRDAKSLDLASDGMEWTRADGTKFRASHRLCAGQTAFAAYPSLDETIDAARAAASISTKEGDTHADR